MYAHSQKKPYIGSRKSSTDRLIRIGVKFLAFHEAFYKVIKVLKSLLYSIKGHYLNQIRRKKRI